LPPALLPAPPERDRVPPNLPLPAAMEMDPPVPRVDEPPESANKPPVPVLDKPPVMLKAPPVPEEAAPTAMDMLPVLTPVPVVIKTEPLVAPLSPVLRTRAPELKAPEPDATSTLPVLPPAETADEMETAPEEKPDEVELEVPETMLTAPPLLEELDPAPAAMETAPPLPLLENPAEMVTAPPRALVADWPAMMLTAPPAPDKLDPAATDTEPPTLDDEEDPAEMLIAPAVAAAPLAIVTAPPDVVAPPVDKKIAPEKPFDAVPVDRARKPVDGAPGEETEIPPLVADEESPEEMVTRPPVAEAAPAFRVMLPPALVAVPVESEPTLRVIEPGPAGDAQLPVERTIEPAIAVALEPGLPVKILTLPEEPAVAVSVLRVIDPVTDEPRPLLIVTEPPVLPPETVADPALTTTSPGFEAALPADRYKEPPVEEAVPAAMFMSPEVTPVPVEMNTEPEVEVEVPVVNVAVPLTPPLLVPVEMNTSPPVELNELPPTICTAPPGPAEEVTVLLPPLMETEPPVAPEPPESVA